MGAGARGARAIRGGGGGGRRRRRRRRRQRRRRRRGRISPSPAVETSELFHFFLFRARGMSLSLSVCVNRRTRSVKRTKASWDAKGILLPPLHWGHKRGGGRRKQSRDIELLSPPPFSGCDSDKTPQDLPPSSLRSGWYCHYQARGRAESRCCERGRGGISLRTTHPILQPLFSSARVGGRK